MIKFYVLRTNKAKTGTVGDNMNRINTTNVNNAW